MGGGGGEVFGCGERSCVGAREAGGECEEQACSSKEEYQAYNPLYDDRRSGLQRESFCFRLRFLILYAGSLRLYRYIFLLVPPLKGGRV